MSDLNDLNKPTPTDTEPNVLDTLLAHIIRAATWSGWSATGNKVAGIMSAVTAVVSGGRSLRLYRRNDANTSDEEIVSLPGVSIGGNSATATALATARAIGGVSFNGTADINLPGVNAAGNQSTTGNAATATKLATARTIGGVSFDGTASINLPGVNAAGNQSTTGNAATATALQTARTIGGVSFNGTVNIDLPGVNAAGNQNTSGSAASLSGAATSAIQTSALGSGTASATTFLAGDRTFKTISTTPTTTDVLAATASASVGAVGTYAFLGGSNQYAEGQAPGVTLAGSYLRYAGVASENFSNSNAGAVAAIGGVTTPLGTWRCMGRTSLPAGWTQGASLWLRIS